MTVLDGPKRVVNSRRFKKLLPWVSALVLVAGLVAVMGMYFSNTATVEPKNPTGPSIPAEVPQKDIPFPPAAWRVAREFVFTAVARKNLAESYAITHPDLRGGLTLKDWETGELPVVYMPVAQILKFNWKHTNYAHPRDAQLNIIMIPTKASKQRPGYAQIGLTKVGKASHARWLVSYFQPLGGPPVPTH